MPLTKYNFDVPIEAIELNIKRLTNQLWTLIHTSENKEDKEKQLKTVTLEIAGLNEIFLSFPQFLQLLSKLEGLQQTETEFDFYRKTVFESINLLQEINHVARI